MLNEAALEAVRRDAKEISQRDVYNAVDRVVQVGGRLKEQGDPLSVCACVCVSYRSESAGNARIQKHASV